MRRVVKNNCVFCSLVSVERVACLVSREQIISTQKTKHHGMNNKSNINEITATCNTMSLSLTDNNMPPPPAAAPGLLQSHSTVDALVSASGEKTVPFLK